MSKKTSSRPKPKARLGAGRKPAPSRSRRATPPAAVLDERGIGRTAPARRLENRAPAPAAPTVVAVGASAGGLEAFSQMLAHLDHSPGLALVFIQHLSPHHESALPALLSSRTRLKVVQAASGMKMEPDHVYVIPPNSHLNVVDGELHLVPRPTDHSQYTPVDAFFRSLARWARERAIGVILSGTASDGAAGLREIKAAGGIAIAQKPETAGYGDLRLRPVDVHRVLHDVAPACVAELQAKRLRLELGLGARRHHAPADEMRLHQVFWNLLSNAVKFSEPGGVVLVRTSNEVPGRILIAAVRDRGLWTGPRWRSSSSRSNSAQGPPAPGAASASA